MPSVKIYMDEALLREISAQVEGLILTTREMIMAGLGVTAESCHIVVMGVRSIAGQTPVNIELCLLQKPGRSRDGVAQFCGQLRSHVAGLLDAPSAIRCTMAEPETYIVIRAG